MFTDKLRQLTDAAHKDAEQSDFIGRLLSGQESRESYLRLLSEYSHLYEALETALASAETHPLVALFYDENLNRSAAIRHDLASLDSAPQPPGPTAATYATRLRALATSSPVRLLSHHYLRYLGDLSGGQVIGRLVARHYGLDANSLTIWDFPGIDKIPPYKDNYRAKLNTAFSEDEQHEFVDECLTGYRLAQELFDDLGNRVGTPTA